MLITNKTWEFRQQDYDENIIKDIAEEFNISLITARIIINRGLTSRDDIKKYLNPNISDFYDPFLMKDMEKAVERIIKAINNNERVVIYGDYDVDGITSTSILLNYLRKYLKNVSFYIPDRIEEGYGLTISSLDKLQFNKVDLIITVDCGITAIEEIEYINQKGTDVIITDHHECKDFIPSALAVINPKQKDCNYPFKDLAGVGVVFKLLQALALKMGDENIVDECIGIVALGTVADVVPLLSENRIIVYYGIKKLMDTENLGVKALIQVSGLLGKPITTISIGYILAPRINAAGRIGNASKGVELFLSNTKEEANRIALELDQDNKNRQQTENIILNQVLDMIENDPKIANQKVIILAEEGWHHGVIGIVASKITEKYNKPSILISLDEKEGKGSGRSIPEFNIFEALKSYSELLDKFGGHELAVGLSIKRDNIDKFRKKINDFATATLSEEDFHPKIKIDSQISKADLKLDILNELKILEPYGISNPCPIFLYNDLKIVDCKTVGEDKHIKLKTEDDNLYIDAIGFNLGELASKIDIFDRVDIVCSIESNVWNGQEKLQLNIKDIRTNYEIIFREKYFSTLEKAMFSDIGVNNTAKDMLDKISIFNGDFVSLLESKQKNIILINTLKGAKKFIDVFKKRNTNQKEKFKLYYNYYNTVNTDVSNIVIINPYFKHIEFNEFDNVVMYDLCFSKNQYEYLINNSKNIFIMNDFNNYNNNMDVFWDIIPQRDEFIKVYQYIKSRSINKPLEGDIFTLARGIAISYNIDINSLKLKNIFEIFQELNLISIEVQDQMYKINAVKHNGAKVNIQASKGLSRLLKIKDEFDYFVNCLTQKQIG